MLTRILIYI